jgi:hypothetical protein
MARDRFGIAVSRLDIDVVIPAMTEKYSALFIYSQWGLIPRSLLRLNYGNA